MKSFTGMFLVSSFFVSCAQENSSLARRCNAMFVPSVMLSLSGLKEGDLNSVTPLLQNPRGDISFQRSGESFSSESMASGEFTLVADYKGREVLREDITVSSDQNPCFPLTESRYYLCNEESSSGLSCVKK